MNGAAAADNAHARPAHARGDLLWCDECGRYLPWRHRYQPTMRARVANVLSSAINRALVLPPLRVMAALSEWVGRGRR